MKPVSGKRLCKVLESQGWILLRINGSHHIYARPDRPVILPVPAQVLAFATRSYYPARKFASL
jgi:predicted RNA binding protein YcfA (HicA-like mRNA interferase family)